MTDTVSVPPPPPLAASRHPWLRTAIAIVAAIEALEGIADYANIFEDYGHTEQLLIWAQRINSAKIAIVPVIAAAAFLLALIGRLRSAIVAMAVLMLVVWLADLPSIAINGLELSADFGGITVALQRFLYPLFAVGAILLARRNERPGLATLLVSLPTIIAWVGIAAFTFSVLVYGF